MEALIIGDIHLSGKNPPNRIDDITELQFTKLEEVRDNANLHKIPVICTGDIYHTPIVSNPIMSRFGQIVQDISKGFYFVLGNHDLQYHDIDRIEKTSIGVTWYNNPNFRHIATFENQYNIPWAFIDYGIALNAPSSSRYMLAHKAIVNDKLINTESWIADDKNFCQPVSDFDKMGFKLIVCGHWHRRFIYKHNKTLVINPGPVIRRQITERDVPCMILIDLDSLNYEEVPFGCAKPTDQVLRDTMIRSELKPIADRIIYFINNLRAKKQIKYGINFMGALNQAIDSPEIGSDIKKELIDIMQVIALKKGEKLNADS